MSKDDRPLTVMVEFQMRAEATTPEEWLAEWAIRGDDALHGEPETDTYAAALNEDDDHQVLIFERYRNGERSLAAHIDRPAHQELNTAMGEGKMTKRRVMTSRFHDLADFGWWSRPDADPSPKGAVLRFVGFRFDSDDQRDTFVELTGRHGEYCRENEPGTLIYGAGLAIADADREIDQHGGDLVFVMACSNQAAAEQHAEDPRHLALVAELAERGIVSEPTFRRSYLTSGHGFLWKP